MLEAKMSIALGKESIGYENIRPLNSQGGMGDLFRAHKKGLNVEVVIKRVKAKFQGKLDQENEANILKCLKHQYLPRIYDVIPGEDGYIYTIMDYIPGEDLQRYVERTGPVGQKLAHRWACQLCEVIAYLHAQTPPIIHCDIKPHNIMITAEKNICLIDFNTSLIYSDGQLAVGATHGYAAPEQYLTAQENTVRIQEMYAAETALPGTIIVDETAADSLPETIRIEEGDMPLTPSFSAVVTSRAGAYGVISKQTDIYALGATLYYAVSAKKPEKSLDPVTDLEQYKPSISRSFLAIIRRAMQKHQADRFVDAQEMLRALNNVDRMDERYRRFIVKRRVGWTAVIFAWLLSILCMFYGWVLLCSERDGKYLSTISRGETYDAAGDYDRARVVLQQAIDMSPERPEAYISMAQLFYHQGSYQEAIDLIENARRLIASRGEDSRPADFDYIEGSCFYEKADYENALRYYQAAVDSGESYAFKRGLAMAQARCGHLDEARATLDDMEQNGAGITDCSIVRAEIYVMQGDPENALVEYRQVFRETEDVQLLSHAYLAAAQMSRENGNGSQGIDLLEEAIARLPKSSSIVLMEALADLYSERAQQNQPDAEASWKRVEDLLQEVCSSGGATAVTKLNLSTAQQMLGQYDEAKAILLSLLEDYPFDYRVDMRLAYLYADWQGTKENTEREYAEVESYYLSASEKYKQAQANGQEDQNMMLLKNLVDQLKNTGWLS